MDTLLVVDDEPNVLYSLESGLRSSTLQVMTAGDARKGIQLVREHRPSAVLMDVRLPEMSGIDAFAEIQAIDPNLPVIMMTAYTTTDMAIEAMKRGAFEYLVKPIDLHRLRAVVQSAIELGRRSHTVTNAAETDELESVANTIVGRSDSMQEIYKAIGRVAATDVSVLLLGESGTGKELVARAIHQHSRRCDAPLLAINCAAIPETLLESELFGHEKGSFTGADRLRIGKFEQASGGTLFLDEIGDMSGATQAKILRLLQEQCFERVGGNQSIRTNVRIIAATNRDLKELVETGQFRRDLFYRLNVFTIELPPLRKRLEDLPLLADHFVRLYNREVGKNVRGVSPETMQLLESYRWPGNVRELQSGIKYALVNSRGELLSPDNFPASFRVGGSPVPASTNATGEFNLTEMVHTMLQAGVSDFYRDVLLAVDRTVITEVLRHVDGNQVEASRLLGISRTTLRAKMQSLGITMTRDISTESEHAG